MERTTPLDTAVVLDPEAVAHAAERSGAVNRREALRRAGLYTAALTASPLALAALAQKAYGQTIPQSIRDVLSFALTLEFLEYEFYRDALASVTLVVPPGERDVFETIRDHENDHVRFLQSALGFTPGSNQGRPANGFDFTAGGAFPTWNVDYQTFLVLSQGFEDTGVRAYKGQAANLITNDAILTAALQIHSVEARHASIVRRIRGEKGYITQSNTTAPAGTIQAAYAAGNPAATFPAESNMTQGGVALMATASYNADQITEAFDEPLDMNSVLAIAGPFIRP